MFVKAYYSSGTDGTETLTGSLADVNASKIYLGGKCKSDFGDIRFTDNNGYTLLDYFMVNKTDGSDALFAVEVADSLDEGQSFYCYYGNSEASSLSSAENTFLRVIDTGTPTVLALPMNEGDGSTAYDYSGEGNNGTITGASWTDGKYGKALSFDGVDDYVEVADSESISPTSQVTVACWVKYNAFENVGLVWKHTYNYILYGPENGYIRFRVWDDSGSLSSAQFSQDLINIGEWYFIVGTFGADGRSRIYLNGVQVGSVDNAISGIRDQAGNLYVGFRGDNEHEAYLDGLIDEVRIYDHALTAEEISDIYSYYLFELPEYTDLAGMGFVRKYVDPEPQPLRSYERTVLPALDVANLWLFLYAGDFVGFFNALLTLAFTSLDIAVGVIAMLFLVPLYLRTKSLLLVCIAWILVGSFLIVAMPVVSAIAILFLVLGIGGMIYRLFRPSSSY
mgnify:CR=1 FL=1